MWSVLPGKKHDLLYVIPNQREWAPLYTNLESTLNLIVLFFSACWHSLTYLKLYFCFHALTCFDMKTYAFDFLVLLMFEIMLRIFTI